MESPIQITSLHSPKNGGTLYGAEATNARGRRYRFLTDLRGNVTEVDREEGPFKLGGAPATLWRRQRPPASLVAASKRAIGAR